MTFTDIFVRRPVLATVISLLIVIVGIQAIVKLQIRQYLDLQDEITQRIAAIVEPELGRLEQQRSAAKHPASLDA